jgi:hypothetical protein
VDAYLRPTSATSSSTSYKTSRSQGVRCLQQGTYSAPSLAEIFLFTRLCSAADLAQAASRFLAVGAEAVLQQAHREGKVSALHCKALKRVKFETMEAIVYAHRGFPVAIDGPNSLPSTQELLYVGSATGEKRSNDAREGLSERSPATAGIW